MYCTSYTSEAHKGNTCVLLLAILQRLTKVIPVYCTSYTSEANKGKGNTCVLCTLAILQRLTKVIPVYCTSYTSEAHKGNTCVLH